MLDFDERNGECYRFVNESMTFWDADVHCKKFNPPHGARLAWYHSQSEYDNILHFTR